jgi:hypothetical protein
MLGGKLPFFLEGGWSSRSSPGRFDPASPRQPNADPDPGRMSVELAAGLCDGDVSCTLSSRPSTPSVQVAMVSADGSPTIADTLVSGRPTSSISAGAGAKERETPAVEVTGNETSSRSGAFDHRTGGCADPYRMPELSALLKTGRSVCSLCILLCRSKWSCRWNELLQSPTPQRYSRSSGLWIFT